MQPTRIEPVLPPSVFANRNFLSLLLAHLVSNLGNQMHLLALVWLMNELTDGDTFYIALVAVMQAIPRIVLSPFAGVWVDRWNKLLTMRTVDLISGVIVGCIALFGYLGVMHPTVLLLLTFMLSAASIFFNPARQVLLTKLVAKEQLMQANSYSQTIYTGCMLGGPLLAGIFIGIFGTYLVFVLDAASFFVSFVFLAFIRYREEKYLAESNAENASNFKSELLEGFAVIKEVPVVRAMIPVSLFLNFLLAPINVFLIKKIDAVFHGTAQELSFLGIGFGVGMLIGSVMVGAIAKKARTGVIFFTGLFGSSAGLLLFAWSSATWAGILGMMLVGYFNVYINLTFQTAIQQSVPSEKLGRVFGLLGTVLEGSTPLSNFLFGLILRFVLITPITFVIALLYLLGSVFALTKKPLRNM